MKVVGFAGFSGSGKTTLVEQLIPALQTPRACACLLSSTRITALTLIMRARTRYRHRQAGAFEVVVASSQRLALLREFEQPLPQTVGTSSLPNCMTP
jgi:molybdopterin-guanine dinucleotide biosynthesis protein B